MDRTSTRACGYIAKSRRNPTAVGVSRLDSTARRPYLWDGKSDVIINLQGPTSSYDQTESGMPKRVQRGGSYLCTEQYCTRFMIGTHGKGEITSSANHIDFRCVKSPSEK